MGRRPSPTGTPAESSGGWQDVSFDKSDVLTVAATSPVRTPTPLQRNRRALARGPAIGRARADFGTRFDPAEWRTGESSPITGNERCCPARRERPCRRTAFATVADVSSVYARDWPPKTREPRPLPVRAPAWSLSIALLNAFFWRVPLAERTRTRRRWFLRGHRSRLECPTREKRRFFNCSFCLNHKALGARKPPISTMCARAGPVRVVQDLDKVPAERCVLHRGGRRS
jgi:hypothetical protein